MRITPHIRTSSAFWASPAALGLVLFYSLYAFPADYPYSRSLLPYSPEVVSFALEPFYYLSYATVSCLGAWEAGRLRRDGVWQLAPLRSRYRIALEVLAPVVVLGWAMLVSAIGTALLQEGMLPSLDSLQLPALAATLVLFHATLGFSVGLFVPRLIASPLLAVGVFFLIAVGRSFQTAWPRHMSGAYPTFLSYGELAGGEALIAHVLPTGSLAAGVSLLWLLRSFRSWVPRAGILLTACVLPVTGTAVSYQTVEDWGVMPPASLGNVPVTCKGTDPEVCIPKESSASPSKMQREIESTFSDLSDAGIKVDRPITVKDSIINGSRPRPSTDKTWWIPLTKSEAGSVRYRIAHRAVEFPCRAPDNEIARHSARLWVSSVTGETQRYLSRQRQEKFEWEDGEAGITLKAVEERVGTVREKSAAEQAAWYRAELKRACGTGGA